MCIGMENVYPINEKCVQEWKVYIQSATQSKPNLMKIVCPDTARYSTLK